MGTPKQASALLVAINAGRRKQGKFELGADEAERVRGMVRAATNKQVQTMFDWANQRSGFNRERSEMTVGQRTKIRELETWLYGAPRTTAFTKYTYADASDYMGMLLAELKVSRHIGVEAEAFLNAEDLQQEA